MDTIKTDKTIIGATEVVDLVVRGEQGEKVEFTGVPAKVDTGAASSAVWASGVRVDEEGVLRFCLFGEGSEFFTGEELGCRDYRVGLVRSSNGQEELRYKVLVTLVVAGRRVRASVSLANRERNVYPILIGRRTMKGRFLVDVEKRGVEGMDVKVQQGWNEEMRRDPVGFYQRYMKEGNKKVTKRGLKKLDKCDKVEEENPEVGTGGRLSGGEE